MTRFEYELEKIIKAEQERLIGIVATGNRTVIPDHETYQFYLGQISTLRTVLDRYIPDANANSNKG